jgi:hypothetical protein
MPVQKKSGLIAHTGTPKLSPYCVRSVLFHCSPMARDWRMWLLGNVLPTCKYDAPFFTWDLCTPQNYISYFAWCWSMSRRKIFLSLCVARWSASSCENSKPLFLLHANKTWYTVRTKVLIGVVLSGETEALPNILLSSRMSVEVTNESTMYYLLRCNGKLRCMVLLTPPCFSTSIAVH